MQKLNNIVETTLKKYVGKTIKGLNEALIQTLENRISFSVNLFTSFKEAKKAFQRAYFEELLTLSLGNIKKAASVASLNRRHVHRMCNKLQIDTESIRQEMIKPKYYFEKSFKELVEDKIDEFSAQMQPDNLQKVYKKIPKISENLAEAVEINTPTYEDAFNSFEKNYFEEILRSADFDVEKASKAAKISERSIFRKIKELGIEA